MNYIEQALSLTRRGISVVPLRDDGSKKSKIKWSVFQDRIMSEEEVKHHFAECGGVAAITGEVSRLYVLDFDLKYQHATQDFWRAYMERVPKELRKKLLVNTTRNKGMHVWVRTDFADKSRKLTTRASTIPELMIRFNELVAEGMSELQASEQILKNPFEVVIETRSKGSYAVFYHEDYIRFYGKKLQFLSIEEVELLNEIAYSLDYCYIPVKQNMVRGKTFSIVKRYNEAATPDSVLNLLAKTGMFTFVGTESNGDYKVLRLGSKTEYSGKIFTQNSVLHLFTQNSMFDTTTKSSFSPFEVLMITQGLTYEQAIQSLKPKDQ